MKVLLILIDGMRPDAMVDIPQAQRTMEQAAYALDGKTVFPSCTLPCHMSLFYSRPPLVHGITTNTYTAIKRQKNGLWEVLRRAKKKTAMFYSWEELRDLSKPDCVTDSVFISGKQHGWVEAGRRLTRQCIAYLQEEKPDFAFLYLGDPDNVGHGQGWMSDAYMQSLEESWECTRQVLEALPEEYAVIITADHGGHDKRHTTLMPEDMTVPVLLLNAGLPVGNTVKDYSIMDIAPTVARLLDMQPALEWKGKCLKTEG